MQLVKDKKIKVEGVVLASEDHAGEMHIVEAGDHLVRKGAEIVGGVGLVVGLSRPRCSRRLPSASEPVRCSPSSASTGSRAGSKSS